MRGPSLPVGALKGCARRGGFTLVELLVVVGMIVLLVAIAVPAVGPMLASNQQSKAVSTLGGLLITAQAQAAATATTVGLRIERAFETNDMGFMLDTSKVSSIEPGYDITRPAWRDHQQVRFVTLAASRDQALRHSRDTKVFDLPKDFWVAPDYALAFSSLAESPLFWQPADPRATALNRFENFYILFNKQGELVRYPAADIRYADQTQQYLVGPAVLTPYVGWPDDSARAVLVYDRRQWNEMGREDGAARAQVLSRGGTQLVRISRATGAIVEEKNR